MVKLGISARQLLALFVQVSFFQVVKSHGQSFLEYVDLASAFFRIRSIINSNSSYVSVKACMKPL